MRVQVTAEDIADGYRKDCKNCPVARAISRLMGCEVAVAQEEVVTPVGRYHLPPIVQARIRLFDALGTMEPFEFTLEEKK